MNRFRQWLVVTFAAGTAIAVPIAVVSLQGSGPPGRLFTPVELANGLAFNQGVAAPYLAVFGRPEVPVTGRLLAVERLVDAALRADPALAHRFASNVQSGSAAKVAAALGVLGRLTRTAFGEEFGRASARRMTAWAKATPEDVTITAAAGDPGATCSTCVVNTPPPTVTGPPAPPPPWPPITCLTCEPITLPPPVSAPPPPPPSFTPPPPTCSTCVVNTPPPTVTAPVTGQAQVAWAVSVPSGVALSLPYLMAGPYRAAREERKDLAETVAVVAFTLYAD